jgi:predicted transposase YbfD/YdcC
VVEVTSHVKELRRGKVVKETVTVSYAATDLSPRQANAKVLDRLLRRHWMIENRDHYVRDNRWREDRERGGRATRPS